MDGDRVIANATNASRRALERCVSIGSSMVNEWAENRLMDFNFWDSGVGASSTSRVCLDERLASQPAVRTVVVSLLSTLTIFVHDCIELASGSLTSSCEDIVDDDQYEQEHEQGKNDDKDQDQEHSANEEPDPFDPWSDDSSSGSAASHIVLSQKSPLEQAMGDAEAILDQLIRLGMAIRAAGTFSRLQKADISLTFRDYEHLDDESYSHSHKIDIRDLRALKTHLFTILFARHLREDQPLDLEACLYQLDESHRQSVEQLVFANMRRRNRFTYARKHAEKLGARDHNLSINPEKAPLLRDSSHDLGQETVQMQSLKNTSAVILRSENPVSETLPSEADQPIILKATPSGTSMSRVSVSIEKAGWPRPPRGSRQRNTFRCPCCCQTLSKAEAERRPWRKHLSGDLHPFTCVFPNCKAGAPMFITRDAWKSHLRSDHRSSDYWECFACTTADNSMIFEDSDEFKKHMSLHSDGDAISEASVSQLLGICKRSTPQTIEKCPLCISKPASSNLDPEALLEHIADHVHDFSLFSLPWADDPKDMNEDTELEEGVFARVTNWLNGSAKQGGKDIFISSDRHLVSKRTPSITLHDYFAESSGASSGAHREFDSMDSGPTSDSQSRVDSEVGSDAMEPLFGSSSDTGDGQLGHQTSRRDFQLQDREMNTGTADSDAEVNLEAAIAKAMEALAVTPHGHPDRAERHYELGIRLADLYELTGRIDDLSNAISLCLKAVANTPEDHPNRAGWLSELGIRLADRHHHTGYIDDLINEDGVSTLDENVLYAASFRGYEKLVQILLDKGVNVNAQGGEYGNALQAASHLGYEKVVQILLEKGADVNAQGGEYGNALYAASSEGHINVVQTLLSNGANINAQGGRFNNALYAASSGGHIEVAQMLLDNGADVNAQGGFYGNALQAASAEGHIEVVQMLLDKGANTNARGRFKNALQAALAEGHTEVAQMLFDKSGDVNAQGGEYGNSLERTEEILKDVESPPFLSQENFGEIVSGEGQAVTPHIKCKIEKGFFFSSDRTWTTYRRNYFSVNCSYTLDPYFPHGRLYLSRRNRNAPEQIQAIAMTLSAAIDGAAGKSIELVQHTPKRHKGPQLQIQMERLLPIPPSREETIAPPFLPFQEPYSPIDLSVTSHQHTFERIQFKSATANNGKGRAQQQYCHLFIELYADVRRTFEDLPEWVRVARRMSAPLVVRGRSPSHYEGPHSAGHSISNNLTMPGSSAMGSAVDRADPDLPPQPDPSRDPVDRRTPEDTMGGSLAAMRADDVKE